MSTNLRAVFRPLLAELDLPETEMQEIERVGRMAGLFDAGRTGPGGGTSATPDAIVLMVTALIAGLTKRDGIRLAPFYAASPFHGESGGSKCALTGALTFGQALGRILFDWQVATRIRCVSINHSLKAAKIEFGSAKKANAVQASLFGGEDDDHEPSRMTMTVISGPFFGRLAVRLSELGIVASSSA